MKTLILSFVFIFVFSLYACKKDKNGNNNLKVSYRTNSIVCFPNDSISLSFSIIVENGIPPYDYNWISPEIDFVRDTIIIDLSNNLLINLEVKDAENNTGSLDLEIRRDTIDSLKYDFRNLLIGFYKGSFYSGSQPTYHGPWIYSEGIDSFEIIKNENFSSIYSNRTGEIKYNSKTNAFLGQPVDIVGYFKNDSFIFDVSHYYDYYHFKGIKERK